MKQAHKKGIIIILIITVLLQSIVPISCADTATDQGVAPFLIDKQQEAVALFTQRFVVEGHEKGLLLYSQNRYDRIKGYNLELSSNEYGQYNGVQNNGAPFTNMLVYDSASFVATMYHETLGMKLSANENARDNIYTVKSFMEDARKESSVNNFGFPLGERLYTSEELITYADAGVLKPGDLIVYEDETHIMMYLGNNDDIYYDQLRIDEIEVELQQESGIATGESMTIQPSNPHYFVHAANTSENIAISVLEALPYTARIEVYITNEGTQMKYRDTKFYVIRPMMTQSNGITVQHKINMDIRWPDSSYSAYTKLGIDPVSGQEYEYYYIGTPSIAEYSYSQEFGQQIVTDSAYQYKASENSGTYRENFNPLKWVVNGVGDLVSYFTGTITYLGKAAIVGWTSIIEWLVSDTVQMAGDVQRTITQQVNNNEYAITDASIMNIEDIVYNRVPLFDANIFNRSSVAGVAYSQRKSTEEINTLKEAARNGDIEARKELEDYYHLVLSTMPEQEFTEIEDLIMSEDEQATELLERYREQENITLVIRREVANAYLVIRNIAIVGLLITLIYIGIRMAISSIASQKAKYKGMLVNWCVSLIIVFIIHYIMIFILQINETLINMLPELNEGVSFYEAFRVQAYALNFMDGWTGAIVYIVLVYFMIRFTWIYIKRFFTLCILTIMAPVIGIGYAIDKIKDNKSQSLSRWIKNYVFNVMIQFIHAALYTILMSIVYSIMQDGGEGNVWGATILMFVFLNFIIKAVEIIKHIFRVDDAKTLKNTLEDFGTQMAGLMSITGLLKLQSKLYGRALTPVKVGAEKIVDNIRYEHYKPMDSSVFDGITDQDEKAKKMAEERVRQEKFEKERQAKIKEDKKRRQAYYNMQKKYADNIFNVGKSVAMGAGAIPSLIISPKAGMAMLLTARTTYHKAMQKNKEMQSKILGYDVDQFKGKFAMQKIIVGMTGLGMVVGTVENAKYQAEASKLQERAITSRTNLINLEAAVFNEVNQKMVEMQQKEEELRKELTDKIFEKILDNEIDVNSITDSRLKSMLQSFINGERGIKQELEIKELLEKYIRENQRDMQIQGKLNMELEIMRAILRRLNGGNGDINAYVENGKIMVTIPKKLVEDAIARYSEERMRKQLPVNLGGRHMPEILDYISEYADLKISQQRKVADMELIVSASILKEVLKEIRGSSYREGEEDRNNRYRDPRKDSSLLKENKIEEKEVEQYVQRRIDMDTVNKVGKDDIAKMAEDIFQKSNIQAEQDARQKQEILEAIEGKIADKVEVMQKEKKLAELTGNEYIQEKNLALNIQINEEKKKQLQEAMEQAIREDTQEAGRILRDRLEILLPREELQRAMTNMEIKDLITVISGKAEVQIPEHLLDLERSVHNLQEARRDFKNYESNGTYRDMNARDIVDKIRRQK